MFYLDRLPCPVLVTDCNGGIKYANNDFKRLTDAPLSGDMDQFFPPASRIFLQTHAWPLLLRNGEFNELYLQLQSDSGQLMPVMTNARIIEAEDTAEVIWLFFVAKDRQRFETELLKARQQAQESAAQLAKANLALQSAYAQLANYTVEVESEAEQLAQLSHSDPLTALSNRRALSLHVEHWLASTTAQANGSLVRDAHAAGLKVHPYTFRAENAFLPTSLRNGSEPAERGDIEAELRAFLDTGIDGLFIDQPDIAVRLREQR